MTDKNTLHIEDTQVDDPLAPVTGARRIWIDGRPAGWMLPPVGVCTRHTRNYYENELRANRPEYVPQWFMKAKAEGLL